MPISPPSEQSALIKLTKFSTNTLGRLCWKAHASFEHEEKKDLTQKEKTQEQQSFNLAKIAT